MTVPLSAFVHRIDRPDTERPWPLRITRTRGQIALVGPHCEIVLPGTVIALLRSEVDGVVETSTHARYEVLGRGSGDSWRLRARFEDPVSRYRPAKTLQIIVYADQEDALIRALDTPFTGAGPHAASLPVALFCARPLRAR